MYGYPCTPYYPYGYYPPPLMRFRGRNPFPPELVDPSQPVSTPPIPVRNPPLPVSRNRRPNPPIPIPDPDNGGGGGGGGADEEQGRFTANIAPGSFKNNDGIYSFLTMEGEDQSGDTMSLYSGQFLELRKLGTFRLNITIKVADAAQPALILQYVYPFKPPPTVYIQWNIGLRIGDSDDAQVYEGDVTFTIEKQNIKQYSYLAIKITDAGVNPWKGTVKGGSITITKIG